MDGLHIASEHGVLRFGNCKGHPCWTVLDATFRLAQSRRLDGEVFEGAVWRGCGKHFRGREKSLKAKKPISGSGPKKNFAGS